MMIRDFIIDENCLISTAMEKLDANGRGIIFICENSKLKAVISDGDFRRYIIHGGDINKKVNEIANFSPVFLYADKYVDSYEFMCEKRITSVPILNHKDEIVRIDFIHGKSIYEKNELSVPVVIMAGGKGTRLFPYTNILPKPLIPIGEKTITEAIIDQFEMNGCNDFYMIVNYKKSLIKAFFQDSETNRNVNFVDEEKFYGTGGGIRLLKGIINSTFFLTNCDIIVKANYKEILDYHKRSKNIVTMVCSQKEVEIPYGTVVTDKYGQIEELREKPQLSFLVNTGVYLLEKEFIDIIEENHFVHITDLIQRCIDDGKNVGTFVVDDENWMDMGQLEELEKMKKRMEGEGNK